MSYRYWVIPDERVNNETKVLAHHALAAARKELTLPDIVKMKWFVSDSFKEYESDSCSSFTHSAPINGVFFPKEPNSIYINPLQFKDALQNAVLHETYHLFQMRVGTSFAPTDDSYENDPIEKQAREFSSYIQKVTLLLEDDHLYMDHMVGKDWSVKSSNESHSKNRENATPNNKDSCMEPQSQSGIYNRSRDRSLHAQLKSIRCDRKADAAADIQLINKYSKRQLTPDDVYVYSIALCDNDIDRTDERFTNKALEQLAPLFLGKTGLCDHHWSADKQHSRIYRTEVITTEKLNLLYEPLMVLQADVYMLRTDDTKQMIDAIEGGILREVSIGCNIQSTCSICGKPLHYEWSTLTNQCVNGHIKGQKYEGKLCFGNLEDPTDAFEFSFVAVPAQRSAGVMKEMGSVSAAVQFLLANASELDQHTQELKVLLPIIKKAMMSDAEKKKRSEIAAEAQLRLNQ